LLTIDEAREAVGYDPIGGLASQIMIGANQIPLGMSGFEDASAQDQKAAMELRALGYSEKEIKEAIYGATE